MLGDRRGLAVHFHLVGIDLVILTTRFFHSSFQLNYSILKTKLLDECSIRLL